MGLLRPMNFFFKIKFQVEFILESNSLVAIIYAQGISLYIKVSNGDLLNKEIAKKLEFYFFLIFALGISMHGS